MGSEKKFENRIKEFLKSQNCYYVKYFGCGFTKAGVPDLLCCVNGRFVAIEVKAEKGRVAPLQTYNIEQIKKANGIAIVLYPKDFENFKELIKELKNDGI